MPSERVQRQIDRLLDEAEQAIRDEDWQTVEARCRAVLTLDPENPDAASYLAAARYDIGVPGHAPPPPAAATTAETTSEAETPGVAPVGEPRSIYTQTFVGREAELARLTAAFSAAAGGQGGLVLVVGEPGIGKTTLIEQLVAYVQGHAGRMLVGHCYEEGSLSLPYLPFVEAMRSYVLDRSPEQLRWELGSRAPEIARIVSEVRDALQVRPSAPSSDPGEDRYRLFTAVGSVLRNAAGAQPLVLVLEDLHDADRGTLELLQFLARDLGSARLLIIGTYRDVEVDRQHPLSATLAELRRGGRLERVTLRGLTADEVQRMLAAIAGQPVQRPLAEAVFKQTEGNPLFVQEVLRYLAEEGLIERAGGRWRAAGGVSLLDTIPEGLRDVIGKRLSRLSESCNRLLAVAAVIGRDFELETLLTIGGEPEERTVALLEEAIKIAVVQDTSRPGSVRYRFSHAFFRQTLYEELSTPRRLRLHQQVARALEEQYASRLDEHAAELAEHFAQSSDAAELAKAVQYGRLAARRASSVYAFGEAVRLLDQTLEVQEVLDSGDRCAVRDLLLELADALLAAGEPQRVIDNVAERAFLLADALDDAGGVVRACWQAMTALSAVASGLSLGMPEYAVWAKRLGRYASRDPIAAALSNVAQGGTLWAAGELAETRRLVDEALTLAREAGRPDVGVIAAHLGVMPMGQDDIAWRYANAQQFQYASHAGAPSLYVAFTYMHVVLLYLMHGERARADEALAELRDYVERTQEPSLIFYPLMDELCLATVDGDLDRALRLADEALRRGDELGVPVMARAHVNTFANPVRMYRGMGEVMLAGTTTRPVRALALAQAGRVEEARTLLNEDLAERDIDGPEFHRHTWFIAYLLETALLLGEREAAAKLSRRLDHMADLFTGDFAGACPGRLLGEAAALNGDKPLARGHYERALRAAQKLPMRPEIALIRLDLAELLAEGDEAEHAEAREHLAFCIPEFEAMGMAPALQKAKTLGERLAPPPG
ncbi:MAG TPA: AAA family ATPase, partial [Dehalococcoidia bacterium]|nr:AAA family ATPase [Dehalococcoidia bacterium]